MINSIFAFIIGGLLVFGFYDIAHSGDFERGYEQGRYEQRATEIQQETYRKARLVKYGLCGYAKLTCAHE